MRTPLVIFVFILGLAGCAYNSSSDLEALYGEAVPRSRAVEKLPINHVDYWQDVKPILEQRCVVCHACYDAPCQLKLGAPEGIERGASKQRVYHPERLRAAPLTRLFVDAQSVEAWRDKAFFPVLNEHSSSTEANFHASVLHQILTLKQDNPLPAEKILTDEFTLGINRKESCPTAAAFPDFAQEHPYWGMPYGFPGLSEPELRTITDWIQEGANYTEREPLETNLRDEINRWETFLNQDSLKMRLSARYIYEHLFLAHLYFDQINQRQFFKLVRSYTAPGEPPEIITSRRPYDDPGSERIYYRIVPEHEAIVVKTHMPYPLNDSKMALWKALFLDAEYAVNSLPDYSPATTGNPFSAYRDLPTNSRYRFLLDEAQFSIMNFIKGPVCRGQTALNVIRDHFWVFFISPEFGEAVKTAEFLDQQEENFELPSARGDINLPLTNWLRYSAKQKRLMEARDKYLAGKFSQHPSKVGMNLIWDGEQHNPNAALTVFRNFDSATVEKGLIGDTPQTAWVIGYPQLERIHYLLVAGYDVYGNVGHQLLSRLYMDFLRMESESNFLMLLPTDTRQKERANWYRGASKHTLSYLNHPSLDDEVEPTIHYSSGNHKAELFDKIKSHLRPALKNMHQFEPLESDISAALARLSQLAGEKTHYLPEFSLLNIIEEDKHLQVTLLKNTAHLNITSMFNEYKNIIESENTMTMTRGLIGAYPNAFFWVKREQLSQFVHAISGIGSAEQYEALLDDYGIRRTNPQFWKYSDAIHLQFAADAPVNFGYLDYNRFENR